MELSPACVSELENASASVPEFSLNGKRIHGKVVACYDGDTFHAVIHLMNGLMKFNCRMAGYDTPEMKPPANKPGRELEKQRALIAKQALLSKVCDGIDISGVYTKYELDELVKYNKKIIVLECEEFDKYGRLLVRVPMQGNSTVNDWMIANGYGYAYNGGTKQ